MQDQIPGVPSDPEILGGTAVFVGTRVPVRALFDFLERGQALSDFWMTFQPVEKAQAVGVLTPDRKNFVRVEPSDSRHDEEPLRCSSLPQARIERSDGSGSGVERGREMQRVECAKRNGERQQQALGAAVDRWRQLGVM